MAAFSLGLLSYFDLNPAWKWAVGLIGLAFPTVLALRAALPVASRQEPFPREDRPDLPAWPFLLLLALAAFVRFKDLTTFLAWPGMDDGAGAFYAMELKDEGRWRFFYPFSQVPPAFYWLLALFFRFLQPSLFSLWLFPALLATGSVGFCYLALRARFSPVFSLVFLFLLAFDFWHLYTGRFCIYLGLLFFWEMLAFWALAVFLKKASSPQGRVWAVFLGLVAGAGLFVAISWPVVLALLALAVYGATVGKGQKGFRPDFLWFSAGVLFFSILFLAAAAREHYGKYISDIWAFRGGWSGGASLRDGWLNLATLFADPGMPFHYSLVWGGYFNPFEGALILAGLVECRRNWESPWARWVVAALALFLAPGLVSLRFDVFRMLQALPLLLFLAVLGWMALSQPLTRRKKLFPAALILALCAALDLYHLWGPYHRFWGVPNRNWYIYKSPEFYRAYEILEPLGRGQGPGAVLSDLWCQTGDGTLSLACYAFDAAHNPHISLEKVRWVALLLDPNYKPFLAKDFPRARWYWLDNLYPFNTDGLSMAVLPVTDSTRSRLFDWIKADEALKPVTSEILDNASIAPGKILDQKAALDLMDRAYPSLGPDPFLQSCYWEKAYVRQAASNNPSGMLEALNQGLQKGYPLAPFYNDKGILLAQVGRTAEARECFQKALQAPLNLTSAAQNLEGLEKKTGP